MKNHHIQPKIVGPKKKKKKNQANVTYVDIFKVKNENKMGWILLIFFSTKLMYNIEIVAINRL